MISRRLLSARSVGSARSLVPIVSRISSVQVRRASDDAHLDPDVADPNMNGGYVNPPRISRQFRDPHADWWDKQERRNFGEPVHEDNDILGIFAPEEYTHSTPGKAFFHLLCFIAAFSGVCAAVYQVYPDRAATPRTFPDALESELGGTETIVARKHGDDEV